MSLAKKCDRCGNASGSCATMTRECKDCRREFWLHKV